MMQYFKGVIIFSPNLKKFLFPLFNIRMSLRTVMYQDGPEYKPDTSESPKHIEYGFPAQIVAQIARGWHGDHCAKRSPGTDEGCEPEIVAIREVFSPF